MVPPWLPHVTLPMEYEQREQETVSPGLRIIFHDVRDMLEYIFRCSDINKYERIKTTRFLSKPSNNKFQNKAYVGIPDLHKQLYTLPQLRHSRFRPVKENMKS